MGSRLFRRTEYFFVALRGRHPWVLPTKKGERWFMLFTWWFFGLKLWSIVMSDFRNESFNRIITHGFIALLACETQYKSNATDGGNEMYMPPKKYIRICKTWTGSQHTANSVMTASNIRITWWFLFLAVTVTCSARWLPSRDAVVLLSFRMMSADKTAMENRGKT